MPRSAASAGAGSKAASTAASIRDSLSGKTRKMVPSAMPAASAICRVVTADAVVEQQGTVAATMAARRSSGGIADPRRRAQLSTGSSSTATDSAET